MKTKHGLFFGFAVFLTAVIFSLSAAGCATHSSIGGTADPHGLISKAKVVANGEEIASYSVILGLFDSGYDDYAAKVRQAEAGGKKITTVTTFLFVLNKVRAYAQ
ncbi:MAG: hypothetical protein Pg6C_07620 [Treponemataceae bacterium]|nr:MAG: hypothetical protein Pg6C_07620 [Treponemataceae bacterium]